MPVYFARFCVGMYFLLCGPSPVISCFPFLVLSLVIFTERLFLLRIFTPLVYFGIYSFLLPVSNHFLFHYTQFSYHYIAICASLPPSISPLPPLHLLSQLFSFWLQSLVVFRSIFTCRSAFLSIFLLQHSVSFWYLYQHFFISTISFLFTFFSAFILYLRTCLTTFCYICFTPFGSFWALYCNFFYFHNYFPFVFQSHFSTVILCPGPYPCMGQSRFLLRGSFPFSRQVVFLLGNRLCLGVPGSLCIGQFIQVSFFPSGVLSLFSRSVVRSPFLTANLLFLCSYLCIGYFTQVSVSPLGLFHFYLSSRLSSRQIFCTLIYNFVLCILHQSQFSSGIISIYLSCRRISRQFLFLGFTFVLVYCTLILQFVCFFLSGIVSLSVVNSFLYHVLVPKSQSYHIINVHVLSTLSQSSRSIFPLFKVPMSEATSCASLYAFLWFNFFTYHMPPLGHFSFVRLITFLMTIFSAQALYVCSAHYQLPLPSYFCLTVQ